MKYLIIILFCLSSINLKAQFAGNTIYSDFNKDGVEDMLEWYSDAGSGFGGRFIELKNGKTKELFSFNTHGCFCQILKFVLIPGELNKAENESFLQAMTKEILPEKRFAPDPSLQWILDGLFSSEEIINIYFDYIINPGTEWRNDKFILPSTYYIDAKDSLVNKFVHYLDEIPEDYSGKDSKGFLIYYGHNHFRNQSGDSISQVDKNNTYKVFRTSHGVLVKKKGLYKWVFVTEQTLTGAPNKLRWESIKKVKLIGDYVIVQQTKPMNEYYDVYVINIESGLCGRLKIDKSVLNDMTAVTINEKSLIINADGKKKEHQLNVLFNELEKLYLKE